MNVRLAALCLGVGALCVTGAGAQLAQPAGVSQALADMVSQQGQHVAFTFDRSMLDAAAGLIDPNNNQPGLSQAARQAMAEVDGVTYESWRYGEPAFYTPEAMAELIASYDAAGWKHLVDANGPRSAAARTMPLRPETDLWLHYHGVTIDGVTVLIRAPRQMNVVEVTGQLRPLDLVHLSGHFGIPRVDPNAVMVPAPPSTPAPQPPPPPPTTAPLRQR